MKKLYTITVALLLVAGSVQAALLASESFEYDTTVGSTKVTNTVYQGGTGWATAGGLTNWVATYASGFRLDDSNGGLGSSLGNINGVGNRIHSIVNTVMGRSLETGFSLDSDHYTAFLARTDDTNDAFRVEFSYTTPGKAIRWKPFELNSDGTIETQAGNTPAVSASPVWSPNTTYLVVSKWDATDDSSYTKIFDISTTTNYLTEVDWENDADVSTNGTSGVTILDAYLTASATGVEIDEFKVGTTYADVVQNYSGDITQPYIAYEGFDYAAGVNFNVPPASNGGTGWTTAWTNTGVSGLSISGTGKSLFFDQGPDLILTNGTHVWSESSKGNARTFDTAVDLNSETLYFTALLRTYGSGFTNAQLRAEFYTGPDASGNSRANVGISGGHLFAAGATSGYLKGGIASNVVAEATTYLLAMKRTGGQSGTISAALIPADGNPATLASEPAWQVTTNGQTGVSLQSIRLLSNSTNPSSGAGIRIDELRIATSWDASVYGMVYENPFPEPPTVEISSNAGLLDFAWNSLSGKVYDLESRSALTSGGWGAYGSYTNLAATPPVNTLTGVATDGTERFYRVLEK